MIDVSDPAHPTKVGAYNAPGWSQPPGVAVAGNYLCVGNGSGGLLILRHRCVASGMISPSGGTLQASRDHTTYTFSFGAFTDTVIITHTARFASEVPSPGVLRGIDHFFDVTAVYSSTGQPAQLAPGEIYTITVQYTDAEKGAAVEDTLGLYWWDGSAWSQKGITSTVDADNNVVEARVDHCSLFAVLAGPRRVYLPLVLKNH